MTTKIQPKDIFAGKTAKDISVLKTATKDLFWVIPIKDYKDTLLSSIDKKIKNANELRYLKLVVRHAAGEKGLESKIADAFKVSGMKAESVSKDFGELLSPFYAATYLDKFMRNENVSVSKTTLRAAYGEPGKKVNNICFPTAQNYPVFDFFIQNGYYFGFSVKTYPGSTNTFSPTYISEKFESMPEKSKNELRKKFSPLEFNIVSILGTESMLGGPVKAFAELIFNRGDHFEKIENMRKIFSGITKKDFDSDALLIEKAGRDKPLDKLGLKGYKSYVRFMNEFVIQDTREDEKIKKKYQTGDKEYNTTNLVYGFIKYLAKPSYGVTEILGSLFPDLNIVKITIDRNGLPGFKLVTMIKIADKRAELEGACDLRSKASFSRVKDKLGLQL